MARKKEPVVAIESLYLPKITDDQIAEYVLNELRQHLPNREFPIKLMMANGKPYTSVVKEDNVYYVRLGKIIRENGKAYFNVAVDYSILNQGRWPQSKGYNLNLEISDYDCVNRTTKDGYSHPNETWVDFVHSIVKDKSYMAKAQKYMHEKYPFYFEQKSRGYTFHARGRGNTNEKPRLEL